jgi:hypothetical protein
MNATKILSPETDIYVFKSLFYMAKTTTDLSSSTRQKGLMVRTTASYLGGLGFKY